MRDKQIKLIYFSFRGSDVKQISLSWIQIFSFVFTALIITILLSSFVIGLSTDYFHNWRISNLLNTNKELKTLLDEMNARVENLQTKVHGLEKEDNDFRVVVGMPQIDSDVRKLGIGGYTHTGIDNNSSADLREQALKVRDLLSNLEQRVQLAEESRKAILSKYAEDMNRIKRTPSIRPVVNGSKTTGFGYRIDPWLGKRKYHYGLDIAAKVGTPVYCTADGVVTQVITRYKPNRSYGKLIEVDHGYGIKTRYAHLHKTLIRKGQKVKRGTIIAQVGNTGRSTGPHLHYEVLEEDNPVNPERYILE